MNPNILIDYVIIAIVFLFSLGIYVLLKAIRRDVKKLLIIMAAAVGLTFFIRYLWDMPPITYRSGISTEDAFNDFLSATLIWFGTFNVLALVFNVVYKFRFLKIFVSFYVLPFIVLTIIKFPVICSELSYKYLDGLFDAKLVFFAAEIGFSLALSVMYIIENRKIKITKKDLVSLLYAIPMLLACMPGEYLTQIFGVTKEYPFTMLRAGHRILMYLAIIIPFIIYYIYKDKPYETKKFALLWYAFGAMISFTRVFPFADYLRPYSWPLHLCSTAMFLIPLCLVFRLNKVFYFTYFINVLGAFIALLLPNVPDFAGWGSTRIVKYHINHFVAFYLPILIVALGIYPKPNRKQFKNAMIGFACYYLLVLFLNSYMTAKYVLELKALNKEIVDFFYVNGTFVTDRFGSLGKAVRELVVTVDLDGLKLKFYPVYQSIFFVIYILLSLSMWVIYATGYQIADKYHRLARLKEKIKLNQEAFLARLDGKDIAEPINKGGVNMLKISHFYKKYGTNKHYAVQDVNLEVGAGEIFGFLGPNGAGKSTVIKSIVGLQSITSGNIEICGYDITHQSVQAKRNVGYVPDHYALYEKLTGRQYINYIADIYHVSKKDRDERIEDMLTRFELKQVFDSPIRTYSHGMKQKIAIMAALIHHPKLWILDEPLTGLDPNSIMQVKELMRSYAAEGNIVFFSSHIIDVVERICTSIAIINKGKIMVKVNMSELDDVNLEHYYMNIINSDKGAVDENTNSVSALAIKESH